MSERSQADDVRRIEEALLALRPGPGRGGPFGRAPWGDGPPPWAGGHGHGHGLPGGRMRGRGHDPHEDHHDHHRGPGPHGRGMHGGARIRLLEFLAAAAPDARVGISEIAELIGVDQPRASRLVADSVSRGFATRDVDPRDARKSVVTITAAGRAMLEQVRTGRRSAVTDALAGFSEDETAQLAELLSRFVAAWPRG